MRLGVPLVLFLFSCGETTEPMDGSSSDGGGADGGSLDAGQVGTDSAVRLDGAPDTRADASMDTSGALCEGMPDGHECGAHRECQSGECVFDQPDVPCDYDFASAPAGAFLVIACDHDLAGIAVQLASDITLEYNGGSIINGTLRTDATSIHGELLNLSLQVEVGGESELIDPVFRFRQERWDVEEGVVSDAVAVNNRDHINAAIELVKALSGNTFVIGELDVFLDVATGPFNDRAVRLPSDFHLRMSDATHLRVQPNAHWEYSLIITQNTNNVRITGGHLWGDRFTHDYSVGTRRHDQGLGVYLVSAQNVVVEDLSANQFTGDGLLVGSSSLRNDDGSPREGRQYAENIEVRRCVFDENRRNGLALTDVDGALLEDLTITRTALGDRDLDGPSSGTSPRAGIQIEPITGFLPGTETLRIRQYVTNVQIRNSRFDGNYGSDITFHHCDNTEVYGNHFGGSTSAVSAAGVELHHNVYVADRPDRARAISVQARQRDSGYHIIRDWHIHDNTIDGYETGISVGGVGQRVIDNTIRDFRLGIFIGTNLDLLIENNTLTSTRENSRAYANLRGGQRVVIGTIRGGSASCSDQPFRAVDINNEAESGARLVVQDIHFSSTTGAPVYVQDSSHITIERCTADEFRQVRGMDIVFQDNTIR